MVCEINAGLNMSHSYNHAGLVLHYFVTNLRKEKQMDYFDLLTNKYTNFTFNACFNVLENKCYKQAKIRLKQAKILSGKSNTFVVLLK